MCGRFALGIPRKRLAEELGLDAVPDAPDRFNIAPGQLVEAVVDAGFGRREMRLFRWGLVPSWSKEGGKGRGFVNARLETAAEKPSFRAAMRYRRCLMPASGFYEWQVRPGGKQPWYFYRADGRLAALAGIWERYEGAMGEIMESCAILTTEADAVVSPVHERMPVAVAPEDYGRWLDADMRDGARAVSIFRRLGPSIWAGHPVGPGVNRVAANDEQLLLPLTRG
ncbi:SOS response-associated peptidase [Desulfolutivibrio sp.]|uniref:SOS response-associated peptidase n=1 Tax=Desulfolutivibrio sp. TaxID=2773296 RepID=UPI002F96CDB1